MQEEEYWGKECWECRKEGKEGAQGLYKQEVEEFQGFEALGVEMEREGIVGEE